MRRYGPRLGAGTALVEKDAEKTVTPDALGSTAYVGPMDRGPVGQVIPILGPRDLEKKTGAYIPGSLVPDCARHFWQSGEGAGILFGYRVTDGNEVKASLDVWDRNQTLRNKVMRVDANNGGSWAGRRATVVLDLDDPTDVGVTTITLPALYVVPADYWKGGTITITALPKTYKIVSNTEGDGITGADVTLEADQDADADYGVETDTECVLSVTQVDEWGRDKNLSVLFKDGESDSTNYWGMTVYLDGEVVRDYTDLSSDPANSRYYTPIINNDEANHYLTVTDLWSGSVTAQTRPANHFGKIDTAAITATELDLDQQLVRVDASNAGANTIAAFTYGSSVVRDRLKITYQTGTTDWNVESLSAMKYHVFPTATGGVAYVADNDYSIGFTITESTPANGEYFTVDVLPLVVDECIGGKVYPDTVNYPNKGYTITDNDEETVTISSGDLTVEGAVGDYYRLEYAQELEGGYDGLAALSSSDYAAAFDVNTSPFNDIIGQGFGLIKFATPGITEILDSTNSTAVQKAGIAYCYAKNFQFREEIPKGTADEYSAKTYVQTTIGKSDYVKVIFPSYWQMQHPVKKDLLRDIPLTGKVHGREAREARRYSGYHKPAAGTDNTLDGLVKPPSVFTEVPIFVLDHEILNPAGIQAVAMKGGNPVIWGARLPASDPAWKFSNHREQFSYYEHVLLYSYDWLIFKLNNPDTWAEAEASLTSFFLPEWRKGALQGDDFEDGCQIKIDAENNTPTTRALGDLNMEITLWPADFVERAIFIVGKKGVFLNVAAA